MPGLTTESSSTVTAVDHLGQRVDARDAAARALPDFLLDSFPQGWVDDRVMVTGDVVLRDFTFVLFNLFRQEVDGEGLLDQHITLALLVAQDRVDGRDGPDSFAARGGDAIRGEFSCDL